MINDDTITTFGNEYTVCINGQEFGTSGYFLTLSCKGWAETSRGYAGANRIKRSTGNRKTPTAPKNTLPHAAIRTATRLRKIARELILRNEPLAYMLWEDRECVGGKPSC